MGLFASTHTAHPFPVARLLQFAADPLTIFGEPSCLLLSQFDAELFQLRHPFLGVVAGGGDMTTLIPVRIDAVLDDHEPIDRVIVRIHRRHRTHSVADRLGSKRTLLLTEQERHLPSARERQVSGLQADDRYRLVVVALGPGPAGGVGVAGFGVVDQSQESGRVGGDVLAEHMQAQGLTGADGDEWVFRSPRGGPLRYSMWHLRVWIPAREGVGRPALGFHDLRHFHASQLVEAGVDVKVSQELMGHEDIRLTRGLYAQAGDDLKQRANDAVAAQLIGTLDRRAMESDRDTSR